jgi:hypothetical protein
MSDQIKYEVVSRVLNGIEPKCISAELDISYNKVLRIKREYELAKANNTTAEFIDISKVVLDKALDDVIENTPDDLLPAVNEAVSDIKATKFAIDKLSDNMIATAEQLNTRIRAMSLSIDHVSELEALTSALCSLQVAFFNSNKTQVNVQNNFGDAGATNSEYGEFLGD